MDCKKIFDDNYIKPSFLTAVYSTLSIGMYNYHMDWNNMTTYINYRKCITNNLQNIEFEIKDKKYIK